VTYAAVAVSQLHQVTSSHASVVRLSPWVHRAASLYTAGLHPPPHAAVQCLPQARGFVPMIVDRVSEVCRYHPATRWLSSWPTAVDVRAPTAAAALPSSAAVAVTVSLLAAKSINDNIRKNSPSFYWHVILHCGQKKHPLLFSCITLRKVTNLNENYRQNS